MQFKTIYDKEHIDVFLAWLKWELNKARATRCFDGEIESLLQLKVLQEVLDNIYSNISSSSAKGIHALPIPAFAYANTILKSYNVGRNEKAQWMKIPWNKYDPTHVIMFLLVHMQMQHSYVQPYDQLGHTRVSDGSRIKFTLKARDKLQAAIFTHNQPLSDSLRKWDRHCANCQMENEKLTDHIMRINPRAYKNLIFIKHESGIIPQLFLYQNLILNSASCQQSDEYGSLWALALRSEGLYSRMHSEILHDQSCIDELNKLDQTIIPEKENVEKGYQKLVESRSGLNNTIGDILTMFNPNKQPPKLFLPCDINKIWELMKCLKEFRDAHHERQKTWEEMIIPIFVRISRTRTFCPASDKVPNSGDSNSSSEKSEPSIKDSNSSWTPNSSISDASSENKNRPNEEPVPNKSRSILRRNIKENLDLLCRCTTVECSLCNSLFSAQIITSKKRDEIMSPATGYDKADNLYRYFYQSVSDSQLPRLMDALRVSGNGRAIEVLERKLSHDLILNSRIKIKDYSKVK